MPRRIVVCYFLFKFLILIFTNNCHIPTFSTIKVNFMSFKLQEVRGVRLLEIKLVNFVRGVRILESERLLERIWYSFLNRHLKKIADMKSMIAVLVFILIFYALNYSYSYHLHCDLLHNPSNLCIRDLTESHSNTKDLIIISESNMTLIMIF